MLQLREKCLKNSISLEINNNSKNNNKVENNNNNVHPMLKLLSLQRNLRANIINQNISQIKSSLQPFPLPIVVKNNNTNNNNSNNSNNLQSNQTSTEVRLLPPDQFYRSKKHNKRDIKGMEKEMKKKKAEKDEARR